MAIHFPSMLLKAKKLLKKQALLVRDHQQVHQVPKGHVPVYVGELQKKRFIVPISCLNHPSFMDLLKRADEENGFDQPIMGGLTIPCKVDTFIHVTSQLIAS